VLWDPGEVARITPVMAAVATKATRQSISAESPPMNGAPAPPMAWKLLYIPMRRPRNRSGVISARLARSRGVKKALAAPWRALATRNGPRLGARATRRQAAR